MYIHVNIFNIYIEINIVLCVLYCIDEYIYIYVYIYIYIYTYMYVLDKQKKL